MKKLFIVLAVVATYGTASAQMSLGFVKNCMTYDRTAYTNEMFRKHFSTVENAIEKAQNPLLIGAMSYSNEKNPADGEIKVLSLIKGKEQITEIYFVNGPKNNYDKNFTEVYNQMVSFFDNQTTFKSPKYDNVNVTKFTKDKTYYYSYKLKEIPVIVVANMKLDESYFGVKN